MKVVNDDYWWIGNFAVAHSCHESAGSTLGDLLIAQLQNCKRLACPGSRPATSQRLEDPSCPLPSANQRSTAIGTCVAPRASGIPLAARAVRRRRQNSGPGDARSRHLAQESFNVAQIPGPVCDRLHDEKIFHLRQSHPHAAKVVHCGSRLCLGFERQSAKDDVNVDARFGVTKKQHARAAGKLQGILDAGKNAVGFRGFEQLRPVVLWSHGKGVYVTSDAGPSENRCGDAADYHCGNTGRLEPLREIGEGGDK